MALTVTRLFGPWSDGPTRKVVVRITFDDSYPTGGESLTPGMVGLSEILKVDLDGYDTVAARLSFDYDYANQKIVAIFPTGGATGATSLADPVVATPSGSTAVTSSSAQPNLTVTGGRGIEVGNTANLSTVILQGIIVGF